MHKTKLALCIIKIRTMFTFHPQFISSVFQFKGGEERERDYFLACKLGWTENISHLLFNLFHKRSPTTVSLAIQYLGMNPTECNEAFLILREDTIHALIFYWERREEIICKIWKFIMSSYASVLRFDKDLRDIHPWKCFCEIALSPSGVKWR